ncbi:uncharacterized protein LOC128717807 [Anopheles marshallii]|uniref:uncharacterized protein LOC128717807 n=1 Tax=Anopheles marshallii TaxID=1521116 RepID=UPI00237BCFA0|nr:uncharacterized protein LOC128717807 [Anopheles marshallii]
MSSSAIKILRNVLILLVVYALSNDFVPFSTAQLSRKSSRMNVSHSMRITNIQCVKTPYRNTQLHYCRMEQYPNGTTGLNVSATVPVVVNYATVAVKAFYKYTTYQPFMIDWCMEYCHAARNRNFNPSTAIIMKVIEGSLPQYSYPCPHGKQTYNAFWMLENRYLLQSLPSGNYRLDIDIKDSEDGYLFAMQLFGVIRRQGIVG